MSLDKYIRHIDDFPKPGIGFKDITPLLNDFDARSECLNILQNSVMNIKPDKIVGIESRGFFFGMLLAQQFECGFVPIRKKNKLPYSTFSATYDLEYGSDELQMHTDAIQKGDRVIIHDDVLATGGTAKAACELVEEAGGIIIQCNFLMELDFLKGRQKIENYTIFAALHY